jgi:hypothetical protein
VPFYRLYFLDLKDHIHNVAELECRDDTHAVETAQARHDGRPMELWLRDRLVWRFEARASGR